MKQVNRYIINFDNRYCILQFIANIYVRIYIDREIWTDRDILDIDRYSVCMCVWH